jgi:hypothetical protein
VRWRRFVSIILHKISEHPGFYLSGRLTAPSAQSDVNSPWFTCFKTARFSAQVLDARISGRSRPYVDYRGAGIRVIDVERVAGFVALHPLLILGGMRDRLHFTVWHGRTNPTVGFLQKKLPTRNPALSAKAAGARIEKLSRN